MDAIDSKARELLSDSGITEGDARYLEYLAMLFEDPAGFKKWGDAVDFDLGMYYTYDHPGGLTKEQIDPRYRESYPLIAAVGVIESAKQFNSTARQIRDTGVVSIPTCVNYAALLSRIKWLCTPLNLKETRKRAVSDRQSDSRKAGKHASQERIRKKAEEILKGPKGADFRWNTPTRNGQIKVRKLSKKIVDSVTEEVRERHLRKLIKRGLL